MLLNSHTYFSYKFGTLSVEELIQETTKYQFSNIVLTDINSTSACLDFIRLCKTANIKPICGIDFRNSVDQKYIGIARNNAGFQELNEHLTAHLHQSLQFQNQAPTFNDVYIIYPFERSSYRPLKENEYCGIKISDLSKLRFSEWYQHQKKLVILHPVSFRNQRDFNIHRLLRTMDNNTLLSRLEISEQANQDEVMISEEALLQHFEAYPQIIENTKRIIQDCEIDFDFRTPKNKKCYTSSKDEDFQLLKSECEKGIKYRFGKANSAVIERVKTELKVIRQMDFCSYFLINWDLVNYARSQDFYYIGRGSGANSMLAYLLRITDVDPLELDLYFERFINPARTSPPDFDIDFASRDRNTVTKYLFDRHGYENTALLGSYITFQYKSMIRELGKVFGLPPQEIDDLQANRSGKNLDHIGKLVLKYSQLIKGIPSHLSVHSSGILISEKPISAYSATSMPPKGFPTVHFSMLEAEDLGLAKFDILGQRGLSKIKDCLSLISAKTSNVPDIHNIKTFKDDPKIKNLLKQGKAIGCFYIESPAMRMLLKKLEAEDYLRLVAASSIIRPGVSKSGMMREYILRYRDPSRREVARKDLPELYEILEETYGVMVYQEDVIKVAHYFAGLTLAEADVLRRGMSWKFKQRNEFYKIQDQFFNNCLKKGYPKEKIEAIWFQIESFANYAFSKGHSASYAVESFQALYLKAYYPIEYLTATVNNGGGFYTPELYLHEAKMHGAIIECPCVNLSTKEASIHQKSIYIGFGFLKNLERESIKSILDARKYGDFLSLQNFIERVAISLDQLIILIRIGAFRFSGSSKKELLWEAHLLLSKVKKTNPMQRLFNEEVKKYQLPELTHHQLEDAYDENEILGFPVTVSPFELIKVKPKTQAKARNLENCIGKYVKIVAYLIHVKGTRTSKAERMSFGVFIDEEGHWIDTVQFPDVARKYPLSYRSCYLIEGKVVEEFGFVSIESQSLKRLETYNLEEL